MRKFSDEGASGTIPFKFADYLQLVDWSGRKIRRDKLGHIDDRLPPILTRLNIDPGVWQDAMSPHKNYLVGRSVNWIACGCTLSD